ncbi:MAG: metallophosphoesterase [Nanoarchaeota archaeon]|nr:metallophosphoesterase [Nanoarchaeota archaeon]
MEISDGIDIIDLCLHLKKHNVLIMADTHIGYEEAINKRGVLIPRFQFKEIIQRLEKILKKTGKLDKIIINGDVKHEFGSISEQEWRHTLRLLDFLEKYCKEIILIKGNHDKILGPIAKKRKVKVVDCVIIYSNGVVKSIGINSTNKRPMTNESINKKIKNNTLIIHGDRLNDNIERIIKHSGINKIIIGHEHTAISIQDDSRVETFKCFLKGKWQRKTLIVQPSFNLVAEGTDILKGKLLSPFLNQNLDNFDAFLVADNIYKFGKIKKFRKANNNF